MELKSSFSPSSHSVSAHSIWSRTTTQGKQVDDRITYISSSIWILFSHFFSSLLYSVVRKYLVSEQDPKKVTNYKKNLTSFNDVLYALENKQNFIACENKSPKQFQLNDEIYLPKCKTAKESVNYKNRGLCKCKACILAYHTIQRNDCTTHLNS